MSKSNEEIMKQLAAKFEETLPDGTKIGTLKWREGNKNKVTGNTLILPYLDARMVSKRLTDTLGLNWADEYEETADSGMLCKITLTLADGATITRSDVGTKSTYEKEKGQVSDAFKRAAVKFGIGAYIYELAPVELKKTRDGFLTPDGKTEIKAADLSAFLNGNKPELVSLFSIYSGLSAEKKTELTECFTKIKEAL